MKTDPNLENQIPHIDMDSQLACYKAIRVACQATPEIWAVQGASNISYHLYASGVDDPRIHAAVWMGAASRVDLDTVEREFDARTKELASQLRNFWQVDYTQLQAKDIEKLSPEVRVAVLADLITMRVNAPSRPHLDNDLMGLFLGINEDLDYHWIEVQNSLEKKA